MYTHNTLGTKVPIMLSYPCLSCLHQAIQLDASISFAYQIQHQLHIPRLFPSFSEIPGTCLLSNKVFVWIIYSYEPTYIHQSEFRVRYWM